MLLLRRWVNGQPDSLKRSSAYPSVFGRAFALAFKIVKLGLKDNDLHDTVRDFVEAYVWQLPSPGQYSQEETWV